MVRPLFFVYIAFACAQGAQGQDALGKIFRVDEGAGVPPSPYQIIGVVKDTKYFTICEDFQPITYLPRSQDKNRTSEPQSSCALTLPWIR